MTKASKEEQPHTQLKEIQDSLLEKISQMSMDSGSDWDFGRRAEVALSYIERHGGVTKKQEKAVLDEVFGVCPPKVLIQFEVWLKWDSKQKARDEDNIDICCSSINEVLFGNMLPQALKPEKPKLDFPDSPLVDIMVDTAIDSGSQYIIGVLEILFSELQNRCNVDKYLNALRKEIQKYQEQGGEDMNDDVQEDELSAKIASCFEKKIIDVKPYGNLFYLLLAMQARRILKPEDSIPRFVGLVSDAYPSLIRDGRTKKNYINGIRNVNKKSHHYYQTSVSDQSSMIKFVEEMFPKKTNGEMRKDGISALELTKKLFFQLK